MPFHPPVQLLELVKREGATYCCRIVANRRIREPRVIGRIDTVRFILFKPALDNRWYSRALGGGAADPRKEPTHPHTATPRELLHTCPSSVKVSASTPPGARQGSGPYAQSLPRILPPLRSEARSESW